MGLLRRAVGVALTATLLGGAANAEAPQTFGNKVLGTLGLDAGTQPPPGLYAGNRFLWYSANRVVDRHGNDILAMDLDAFSNAVGVEWSYRVAPIHTYI